MAKVVQKKNAMAGTSAAMWANHMAREIGYVAKLLEWVTKLKTTDAIQGSVTNIWCLASTAPGMWNIMHGCETYNGMIQCLESAQKKMQNKISFCRNTLVNRTPLL